MFGNGKDTPIEEVDTPPARRMVHRAKRNGGEPAKVRIPAGAFGGNAAGRRKLSDAPSPFHKVARTDVTEKQGTSTSAYLHIFPTSDEDTMQSNGVSKGCGFGHDLATDESASESSSCGCCRAKIQTEDTAYRCQICGLTFCAACTDDAKRIDRTAFQSLRCPRRHSLQNFVADRPGYACNICDSSSLVKGANVLGCRKCDFDMCEKCVEVGCKAVSVSSTLPDHPSPTDFARLHCGNGHRLRDFTVLNGAHTCGCCSRASIPRGTKAFACSQCQYELCFECARKALVAHKSGGTGVDSENLLINVDNLLNDKDALWDNCWRWFNTYDVNKDGYLNFVELTTLCGQLLKDLDVPGIDTCVVEQYMKKYDVDGDERLTPKEFFELFTRLLVKAKSIPAPAGIKREALIGKKINGSPSVRYTLKEDLGHGSFGAAQRVIDKMTKKSRVMKTISKKEGHSTQAELELEIECMKKMDHPHILRLFEYYEDANNMYLITDICEGGHLLKVIEDAHRSKIRKPMTERWICSVFRQAIDAVAHCHAHGLIHKDIKAENILLMNRAPATAGKRKKIYEMDPHVVLIDFGLAELFDPSRAFQSKVVAGTPYTMAPEVWASAQNRSKTFGLKCDVYSLGCVLFHILTGKIPVIPKGNNAREWLRAIEGGPEWSLLDSTGASVDARKLVRAMMRTNERERPSSRQCLQSEWFSLHPAEHTQRLSPVAVRELADFCRRSAFERSVLMGVATQVHALDIPEINSIFTALDHTNTGTLSRERVAVALQGLGIEETMALKAVEALDVDGDDNIDYTELVAGLLCAYDDHIDRLLWAAFRSLDLDNDGRLDRKEVATLLSAAEVDGRKIRPSARELDALLDELDGDQDGFIQFDEFRTRFTPKVKRF